MPIPGPSGTQSYIPSRDPAFDTWADNFQTQIAASPATFGLAVPDAVAITAAFDLWHAAFVLAITPATRTKPSVAAKDAQRAASTVTFRTYAQQIRANPGVTNEDKALLLITIPDTGRTPIPAPSTQPLLTLVGATPLTHTLRFADANSPDKRAKPFGALQLEVWRTIGVAPVTDPATSDYFGAATKQPFASTFAPADIGKYATYFGRWVTRTGLVGPWSTPIAMVVV